MVAASVAGLLFHYLKWLCVLKLKLLLFSKEDNLLNVMPLIFVCPV